MRPRHLIVNGPLRADVIREIAEGLEEEDNNSEYGLEEGSESPVASMDNHDRNFGPFEAPPGFPFADLIRQGGIVFHITGPTTIYQNTSVRHTV
jgi:hypothetical protein